MTGTNGSNGENGAKTGTSKVKQGLAQMLKGGVIVSRVTLRGGRRSEIIPWLFVSPLEARSLAGSAVLG